MEVTEQALVLQIGRFREADVWVRFFSSSRGVATAFAFGGAHSRRRFSGCLDVLNHVLFRVKPNRTGDYLILKDGIFVRNWPQLRADWQRGMPALSCCRFTEAVGQGSEGAMTIFRLLLETMNALDVMPTSKYGANFMTLVPMWFRVRLAFELGFAPELDCCLECGRFLLPDWTILENDSEVGSVGWGSGDIPAASINSEDPFVIGRFAIEQGRMLCPDCVASLAGSFSIHCRTLAVSPGSLATLRFIRHEPPSLWSRLRLIPTVRRECAALIDHFIEFHMGLAWDKGRLIRV
ncbi:DNA repair protein RecO [Desulfovibrionales bacterium]